MSIPRSPALVVAAIFLAAGVPAAPAARAADHAVVHLDGGDRLSGEVVDLREGRLTVKPSWSAGGGPVEIDWSVVAGLESDTPLTLVLDDGSRLRGPVGRVGPEEAASASNGPGKRLTVRPADTTAPVVVELARIVAINPPERAVRVTGNASVGLVVNRGNTENRSLYAEGEAVVRTEENRYTLGLQATRAEDGDETTADSSRGWIEADHFVGERWYLSSSALFTRDEFQDLRLRSSLSLSAGYQFLETPRTGLAVELGATYVDERFIEAPDDSYPAGRWSLDLRHRLAGYRVELFHFQEGFLDLEEGGDPLIRSRTGARFNLLDGFIATTQVSFDYDGDPAPGRDKEDWRYLVNLGVEW
ncbi:MAG: DUF481 domain-containing protein [Acidobacteriota bacterium]